MPAVACLPAFARMMPGSSSSFLGMWWWWEGLGQWTPASPQPRILPRNPSWFPTLKFQDIPSCPGVTSPEKSPFCGGCWHEALGMLLPEVTLKVKAEAGGSQGLLGAVQPRVGGYFLLASFCILPKLEFS